MPEAISNNPRQEGSRIANAQDALNIARQLVRDNVEGERGRKVSQLMGMFQGNAPFNASLRLSTGRKWQANFNTQLGAGMLQMGCVPYYNLFEGGPAQVVIKLKNKNKAEAVRKGRVATRHFNRMLKEANLSDPFYRLAYSFVGFGRGFWYWQSPYQWVPDVLRIDQALFPDQASTDPKKWDHFVVRIDMTAPELWSHIRDNEAAEKAGWNVPASVRAIQASQPKPAASLTETTDWVAYQQQLHEHDISTSMTASVLELAYVYVREWDGWSLGIVQLNRPVHDSRGRESQAEWLFHKFKVSDSICDLIAPFIYDPGDGRINGTEGLGTKLYAPISTIDRLVNTMTDGAFLRSMPLLAPRNASARVKGGIQVMAGAAMIPNGFDAQSGQVMADLQGPMLVQRLLLEVVSKTTGVFMPGSERPVGNPDSATAAAMKAQQQTALTASGINRFYNSLDIAWKTTYKRVLEAGTVGGERNEEQELAAEFIKRCKDDGVELKDLRNFDVVRAFKVSGTGSALQRQQSLSSLFPLAGAMPVAGRQNFYEEIVSAAVGPGKVDEFMPEDVDEPGEGNWEANVENVQAMNGSAPLFTENQMHESHLMQHLPALTQGIQSVEQGADPTSVYAFGQLMLPHCEMHASALGQDPALADKAKAYLQQIKILEQKYNQLPQLIRQQQQAAQMQQEAQMVQAGMDPKIQLQAAEKQARTQMKFGQQQADLAMKSQKHQQELRQKEEKHQQDLRQENDS